MSMLRRLLLEEEAQSLVEYGLILGLVSVGLTVALTTMKASLFNIFTEIAAKLDVASRHIK